MKGVYVSWFRQPTTIAGFATLVGTLASVAMHQTSWLNAVPVIAGGLVAIILPDNTMAKSQAVSLATEVEMAIAAGGKSGAGAA
jgi:hypothetical protein